MKSTPIRLIVILASVIFTAGLVLAQNGRPTRKPARSETIDVKPVPPNPPGSLMVDLTLIKSSKDAGLVKLLLDYLPGDEIEKNQDLSTLFVWDLNSSRQVLPSSKIRFYYSELRRTPEGLREFKSAKPMHGPIEIQSTDGEGKPAQSILNRMAIVCVPRVELLQVKGDEGQGDGSRRRFFQYIPATVVVQDKVFAPQRDLVAATGVLPNLQIWRIALEKSPVREELEVLFRFMKPSIDCQNCLDDDKVLSVLERPEFGKYIAECKAFWTKVRQQWGVKQ